MPKGRPPRGNPRPGSHGWPPAATWASLIGATLLVYYPALSGQLLWDDSSHVTKPELQSLHGLWRIWFDLGATQQYYPVLHTAFWVEHRLWGDSVAGYHLVSVLLHAISACLVVWIVRKLMLPGAWLAGFLFALHPVCVEAVAWISEQKSTLSGVFCLAALLAYLGFDQSRRKQTYFLALGFFVLALLSKSVTATLPAVVLVIFWWQRGRLAGCEKTGTDSPFRTLSAGDANKISGRNGCQSPFSRGRLEWRRDVLPLVPWFAVAVPMGLFTAWVERTYIGARGGEFAISLLDRVLIAGRALWFYAANLIWPVGLTFSYPRWKIDPAVWWQYLFPMGALAVGVFLVWTARRRRGPLAAFLIFAGTLFPVLGFLNVLPFRYYWVADHFEYLASIGLLVPLAAWLATKVRYRAVPAVLVAVLGILSVRQSAMYRDDETLYRETLARNPSSWLAHNNLATILETRPGGLMDAIAEYKTALALEPNWAQAHFNLASAYSLLDTPDRIPEAMAEYRAALALNPDYAEADSNLGNLLAHIPGRTAEAIAECQRAVQLRPDLAQTHANLGNLLAQTDGRLPEAIGEFESAVRIDPGSAELRCNLGTALAQTPGRLGDAMAQFQAAIGIKPDFAQAHFLLGMALAQVPGRSADAIAEFQTTLRLQPDFEPAQQAIEELGKR